jgi:4-hydroxybenzoate polyprenyltransferase
MSKYLILVKERVPIVVYLLLVFGICASGITLAGYGFSSTGFWISLTGLFIFFIELRLMDEIKDSDTDKQAHPERPIPRGAISVPEVRKLVHIGICVMFVWIVVTFLTCGVVAGICYLVITGWLILMYFEFFIGKLLSDHPFFYALSHQVIMIPLALYPVLSVDSTMLSSPSAWALGVIMLGGFFSYEVARKLDPNAHEALKTYLSFYGKGQTALIIMVFVTIAGFAALKLGIYKLMWPIEGILLLSLVVIFKWPNKYKIVELIATISLLMHLWCYKLADWIGIIV